MSALKRHGRKRLLPALLAGVVLVSQTLALAHQHDSDLKAGGIYSVCSVCLHQCVEDLPPLPELAIRPISIPWQWFPVGESDSFPKPVHTGHPCRAPPV